MSTAETGILQKNPVDDMHVQNKKYGNLYLAQLVNAQHKNLKTFTVLVDGQVYIIWSY